MGRIGIVAARKVFGLVLQVLLDPRDLISVTRVPDDYLLHAASLGHAEDMHDLRHLERHNLVRVLMNALLLRLSLSRAARQRGCKYGTQTK